MNNNTKWLQYTIESHTRVIKIDQDNIAQIWCIWSINNFNTSILIDDEYRVLEYVDLWGLNLIFDNNNNLIMCSLTCFVI